MPCPARLMAIHASVGLSPQVMAMGIRIIPTNAVAGVGQKKVAQMYMTAANTQNAAVGFFSSLAAGAIISLSAFILTEI